MKPTPIIITLLATLMLSTGCHGRHHRRQVQAIKSMYPPVTIDTKTNTGRVHSLQYSKGARALSQTMDLYLPLKAKPPYPVVIWVHGGSWMYGDKSDNCLPCQFLSSKYAIASINYRLDTETHFPSQIWDVKTAVRYLRSHADEYKLDPKRFAVWGASAGGHLAALLGTSGGVKELEGEEGFNNTSSAVQAVVDWCGPSDFNTAQSQANANCKIKFEGAGSPVFVLMGGKMDKKSLAKASPVTYVSKDDPPFLIMHGDLDDAIPPPQSEQLFKALRAVGVDATYHLLPGCGHGFSAPEHLKLVEDFLDRTLRDPKASP